MAFIHTLNKFTLRELQEKIKEIPVKKDHELVFRVEQNPKKPYLGSPSNLKADWTKLPCPYTDTPAHDIKSKEVCGTSTLKQLIKWWPKKRWEEVAQHGTFLILQAPSKNIIKQKHQTIFNRKKAEILATIDPINKIIKSWN